MNRFRLLGQFYVRDIRNRYLGSISGALWVLLHPALLLALYTFLIAGVLKARIPELPAELWLPYVALGLWPWMCFSDGLQRGCGAVMEHAGLLGKVALPSELLVAASVLASFTLHVAGLAAVLIGLKLYGYPVALRQAWILIPLLGVLLVFTLGTAWIAAAVQVYVRDLAQFLSQLLGFLFFLTPILYAPSMFPPSLASYLAFNPLSYYPTTARAWLLFGERSLDGSDITAILIAFATGMLGYWFFRKLARHFEDFL